MIEQTAKSLFMVPPFTKYAGFYQVLTHGVMDYNNLAYRLIQLGENAHAFRQFDTVREIGQIVSNIPIKQYQAIGYYFLAVAANQKGSGDQEKARELYELATNAAPTQYKAKAILSLAAVSANTGDFESEMYHYKETLKVSGFNPATIEALRGMAIFKAREGYHYHAISDLERLLPLIKYAPPHLYFDYLNSYAIELGATGRKAEAFNITKHVLASPFAFAYPEWRETAEELRPVNRSFVVIDPSPARMGKLLSMPPVEQGEVTTMAWPARVINLSQWKAKMAKDDKPIGELDDREMLLKIVELATTKGLPDEALLEMTSALEKIIKKYTEKKDKE